MDIEMVSDGAGGHWTKLTDGTYSHRCKGMHFFYDTHHRTLNSCYVCGRRIEDFGKLQLSLKVFESIGR